MWQGREQHISKMISLEHRQTGNVYKALQWTGHNKFELQQFGITGTSQGRMTKLNCRGEAFVKAGMFFKPITIGSYVMVDYTDSHNIVYVVLDEETINRYYIRR